MAKVYTVNGAAPGSASSLPDWLTRKRAQKSKGARGAVKEQLESAINVIQSFEFPEASYRVKATRDGHHVLATGVYKPQVKCFDLDQLSQKFERHTDAENVDFVMLSDDWTKSVHLQADRSLELHTQSASHYKTRIPRFGRCVGYHFPSCDVLVGAAGSDVYRLNLDEGRFMTPLALNADGCNALDVNPAHNLLAFGTDAATVEFFDPRARNRVATLQLDSACTALSSRSDGLSLAVGTHAGLTMVYDLRTPHPMARKDQGYGLPVHRVTWLERAPGAGTGALLASADKKVIKLWDRNTPETNFASITPATDINDVHHLPGTGLLLTANEGIPLHAYYIPALGPAPRWCAFLDSLTEELESTNPSTIAAYEDFKFLDKAELARLGLDALLGTPALRPYMHGYFVKLALYDAARIVADPYVYEDARRKKVQQKLDAQADSRIRTSAKSKQVKVNAALAERVSRDEERLEKKRKRKLEEGREEGEGKTKDSLLVDDRFKAVFEDAEFAVDEESREYQLLNPSAAAQKRRKLQRSGESDESESDPAEEDDGEEERDRLRSGLLDSESDPSGSSAGESEDERPARPPTKPDRPARAAPKMVALRADRAGAGGAGSSRDRSAAFGARRQQQKQPHGQRSYTSNGDAEGITFLGKSSRGRVDGPQDFSYIPSGSSSKSKSRERSLGGGKKERFGAGMERGGHEHDEGSGTGKEEERRGRTQRRTGIRSGSRNAFRRL
ncbi:WD40 repeat-like protein [Exidia glandulosa HHB12029]|uniref:WD40 repeat-like protein n=1 Tax=Exidia glandulosa HHB12029 TaxID=1314781 RepID=A0A165DCN9_EXIGL|nr:WD40 repeat-like protein [Exidia glandulosa HHB12029]